MYFVLFIFQKQTLVVLNKDLVPIPDLIQQHMDDPERYPVSALWGKDDKYKYVLYQGKIPVGDPSGSMIRVGGDHVQFIFSRNRKNVQPRPVLLSELLFEQTDITL